MRDIKITFVDHAQKTKEFMCSPLSTVGNLVLRVKLPYSHVEECYQRCRIVDATGRVLEIWEEETVEALVGRSGFQTLWYVEDTKHENMK